MDDLEKESEINVLAAEPKSPPSPHVASERDNDPPDIISLAEKLFQTSIDLQERTPTTSATPYTYPEAILQQTDNANRYYFQFQSFLRQFIQEDQDSLNKSVRWSLKSKIQQTLKKIIEDWLITEQKGRTIQTENEVKKVLPANALFSWSSGDSYIQERRKQIEERKRKNTHAATAANGKSTNMANEKNPESDKELLSKAAKKKAKESIASKLNRTIEAESNKFIHARIQKIKAHHNEQISKKIHERKRKDHENHLLRLKLKEEEYEKSLQLMSNLKQGGFFGTIFGFNNTPSGSKKEVSEGTELNGASSSAEKTNSRPSTPVDLAVETSTRMSTSSTSSTTTSTATDPKVATASSSKNKRFSFLPMATKWSSDGNQNLKRGNEVQPTELFDDTVFDQEAEHEEHQARVSESKMKSHTNSPSLASGVLTPTVLTPTKKGFDIGSSNSGTPILKQEAKFVANNANNYGNGNGDDDDDDDDFSDFASSVPLSVPLPANQVPLLAPTNNRFMAVHTTNINRDLLDLFCNEQNQQLGKQQSQTTSHQAQKNAQVEDLLSL